MLINVSSLSFVLFGSSWREVFVKELFALYLASANSHLIGCIEAPLRDTLWRATDSRTTRFYDSMKRKGEADLAQALVSQRTVAIT